MLVSDDSPVNTNKEWFLMVSKWCETDFVHPQYGLRLMISGAVIYVSHLPGHHWQAKGSALAYGAGGYGGPAMGRQHSQAFGANRFRVRVSSPVQSPVENSIFEYADLRNSKTTTVFRETYKHHWVGMCLCVCVCFVGLGTLGWTSCGPAALGGVAY